MIKPTVGRKVWYRPSEDDIEGKNGQAEMHAIRGEPLDATVVAVFGDRCVNLAIFDIFANVHERRSVTLLQEDDPVPAAGRYAEWMPYQVGQAKKAETAAAKPPMSQTTDQAIEQEIQAKGLTAPRITPADIEANIASEHYFTAGEGVAGATGAYPNNGHPGQPLALLTFCVLVLKNGFTVTGESACASPENFDAEIGQKIARQNAIQKVWPLIGYELRSRLAA